MSANTASGSLTEVKIEHKRRHTQGPEILEVSKIAKISTRSQPEYYEAQKSNYGAENRVRRDFVYLNSAYVGSVEDVDQNRLRAPPTSVIREQYWACSKWPFGQRILAIAVGLLLGTVIGLVVTVVIRGTDKDILPFLVRQSAPD